MKRKSKITFFISFFILTALIVGSAILYTNIRYPLKYEAEISKYSQQYALDKALVCSLINEESSFNKDAISNRGAKGLMQLSSKTAKFIADELGEEYKEEKLFDVDTNIKYGCFYLNYLRQKFVDEVVYLSAYNAGESTVRLWLKDEKTSKNGVTLSNIPFSQTKEYVTKIIQGRKLYKGRI